MSAGCPSPATASATELWYRRQQRCELLPGQLLHPQPGVRLTMDNAIPTAGGVVGGERAEGGVDQIDAGEWRHGDSRLPQQLLALRALLGRPGLAAAQVPRDGVGEGFKAARSGDRQAADQGMGRL